MQLYQEMLRALRVLLRISAAGLVAARDLTDAQMSKLRVGLELMTDEGLRGRLDQITEFLARVPKQSLEIARAYENMAGAMDDDQLRATLSDELLRCAFSWGDEIWTALDEIRRVRAEKGASAALVTGRDRLRAIARTTRMEADNVS